MAAADLTADIAQQAVEPLTVVSDGQTVTGRPVADQVKADQYLNNRAAAPNRRRGLYLSKLISPGCVSDQGVASGPSCLGGFC